MVGPGECSVTEFAVERFVARVFALVPRELVAARKPPAAVLPLANVRLLARVRPQVGLDRLIIVNLILDNTFSFNRTFVQRICLI